jgi:hypothetical protein
VADIGGQLLFDELTHFLAEVIFFGAEVKIHDRGSALYGVPEGAMVPSIGVPVKDCIAEHCSTKMQQVRIVAFHVPKVNDRRR